MLVHFSLPDAASAQLEILDITGRRIALRQVGTLGPGDHILPLGLTRRIEPGIYIIRLTRKDGRLTRRAVVLR